MYPSGYHIGSAYQPRVSGYSRRMKVMALNFCHGQVRTPVLGTGAVLLACCNAAAAGMLP